MYLVAVWADQGALELPLEEVHNHRVVAPPVESPRELRKLVLKP